MMRVEEDEQRFPGHAESLSVLPNVYRRADQPPLRA